MNDDAPDLHDRNGPPQPLAAPGERRRYRPPRLTDLGDLRRLTAAGNPASQADLGGTWPNMQKLTMLG